MPLKVIQINLNRSRLAQDIMIQNVSVLGADIVIISEPFRQSGDWFNDVTGDALIWVTGFNGKFPLVAPPLAAEGLVGAIVGEVAFLSGYFSPRRSLSEFGRYLDSLEELISEARVRRCGVVVAGDLNAMSPAWGRG